MQAQTAQCDIDVDLAYNSPDAVNTLPTEASLDPSWIRDARKAMRDAPVDYFKVKAFRYWLDFMFSLVCAYGASTVFLLAPLGSLVQIATFPIAVFWLYRLGSLVHEVCHLGQHEMRGFKATWNLLVGVMTFTPSPFFYTAPSRSSQPAILWYARRSRVRCERFGKW